MEKSGGFDMSKMSMASKIIMGAGILLLIDSFLSWQKVCVSDVLGGLSAVSVTSASRRTPGAAAEAGPASSWGSC